jgi:hypothetical protein
MNTTEKLKELKTKLENLERLLEDAKQEHYNNIVRVDKYDNAVNRVIESVKPFNTSVDIQEIIDGI